MCGGVQDRENPFKVRVYSYLLKHIFACVLFGNQRAHVGVGAEAKTMTDISVFLCLLLLVLQACFCVTQTVRCVKQILSNRVFVLSCMQSFNLDPDFKLQIEIYTDSLL